MTIEKLAVKNGSNQQKAQVTGNVNMKNLTRKASILTGRLIKQ